MGGQFCGFLATPSGAIYFFRQLNFENINLRANFQDGYFAYFIFLLVLITFRDHICSFIKQIIYIITRTCSYLRQSVNIFRMAILHILFFYLF